METGHCIHKEHDFSAKDRWFSASQNAAMGQYKEVARTQVGQAHLQLDGIHGLDVHER